MSKLKPEYKQIGHSSLYIVSCKEEKPRTEEQSKSLGKEIQLSDINVSRFKIAYLDYDKNPIDYELIFEGPQMAYFAESLSNALQNLQKRVSPVQAFGDVEVTRLDKGDALIKKGKFSIEIPSENVDELAIQLGSLYRYILQNPKNRS